MKIKFHDAFQTPWYLSWLGLIWVSLHSYFEVIYTPGLQHPQG